MTDGKSKTLEAMGRLLLLTQNGEISWYLVDSEDVQNKKKDDEIISSVFRAEHKDKLLQIYRRRYQQLYTSVPFFVSGSSSKEPQVRWRTDVCLELIDPDGALLWEFPEEEILTDLLEAIRFKVSGAGDLIDSLLE